MGLPAERHTGLLHAPAGWEYGLQSAHQIRTRCSGSRTFLSPGLVSKASYQASTLRSGRTRPNRRARPGPLRKVPLTCSAGAAAGPRHWQAMESFKLNPKGEWEVVQSRAREKPIPSDPGTYCVCRPNAAQPAAPRHHDRLVRDDPRAVPGHLALPRSHPMVLDPHCPDPANRLGRVDEAAVGA